MAIMDQLSSWFEFVRRRSTIASVLSGILFFVGWWVIIDAAATAKVERVGFTNFICGILGTLSFLIVNAMTNDRINNAAAYDGGVCNGNGAKVFLFGGFVITFAAVIASIWIMVDGFITRDEVVDKYPGYAIFIQNIFICASSLIFKFARGNSDSEYYGGNMF